LISPHGNWHGVFIKGKRGNQDKGANATDNFIEHGCQASLFPATRCYSSFKTKIGSTRVARMAGDRHAISAIGAIVPATAAGWHGEAEPSH